MHSTCCTPCRRGCIEEGQGKGKEAPICLYSTANEHCVILLLLHCVSAHTVIGESAGGGSSSDGSRKFRAAYHTYYICLPIVVVVAAFWAFLIMKFRGGKLCKKVGRKV